MRARVIPCLLLDGAGLVKTRKFRDPVYLGDPINIIRIFNDKEVDEVALLDIRATREGREPDLDLLGRVASECFMPLAYGGGVRSTETVRAVLKIGCEKVIINSQAAEDPSFLSRSAEVVGCQSIVASIDVKRTLLGRYHVWTHGGRRRLRVDPVEYAQQLVERGAGEILLNSIDRDGTMRGYDLDLVRSVVTAVDVPVVACGGAAGLADLRRATREAGAAACGVGSFFVFHGCHRAVLIHVPSADALHRALSGDDDA